MIVNFGHNSRAGMMVRVVKLYKRKGWKCQQNRWVRFRR